MSSVSVLWIDARLRDTCNNLCQSVMGIYDIHIISSYSNLSDSVVGVRPRLIIFDFDFPDLAGLCALQRTKRAYNGVPVLMLTNEHSENLAVWALRTRVWDYLVKPFSSEILLERISLLQGRQHVVRDDQTRVNFMPIPPIPVESRFRNQIDAEQTSRAACAYVETHLHEKILIETVAQICGMSRFEFSRAFKREHGMTFRNYVIDCRLKRAAAMLCQTTSTITDVAFSVGFQDLSNFSRLFRRTMGHAPREYRLLHQVES